MRAGQSGTIGICVFLKTHRYMKLHMTFYKQQTQLVLHDSVELWGSVPRLCESLSGEIAPPLDWEARRCLAILLSTYTAEESRGVKS